MGSSACCALFLWSGLFASLHSSDSFSSCSGGRILRELLKDVYRKWRHDNVTRLAAALAYYTVFSTAAFLVLLVSTASLGLSSALPRDELIQAAQSRFGLFGTFGAQAMLVDVSNRSGTIVASGISLVVLVFGATRVFTQLQYALDTVWEVRTRPGMGLVRILRKRLLAFGSVLLAGLLLFLSLGFKTVKAMGAGLLGAQPSDYPFLWRATDVVVSYALLLFVFALVLRVMPSVKIGWGDVWLGAAITAVLFWLGRYLFGIYVARSVFASVYGAAGTFLIVLLWYYYLSLIILLGAECTYVYATRFGSHVKLARNIRTLIRDEAR